MNTKGLLMKTNAPLLDVIACSVTDAVAAEQGGADRLELISRFDLGGLTPDLDLVDQVLAAVSIPVRVMVREKTDFHLNDICERKGVLRKAHQLAQRPIHGLVAGFLHNGQIDEPFMRELLSCAPHLPLTFHRAFERLDQPEPAIGILKTMPQIDRLLTSAGQEQGLARTTRLQRLAHLASPEIALLIGGGITLDTITQLAFSGFEFHMGRGVRQDYSIHGQVQPQLVQAAKKTLASLVIPDA